ncbi:hypothetical protein AB0L13_20195 [Saccharopolyspora shandongensis]|uniref:hypothetical protein n=1 Tax=Saccharopolyspora shandongensis TaxID=418495 RepID=UPI00344814AC
MHIVAFTALATADYLGTCVLWPYKICRTCQGRGRLSRLLGVRLCPTCDATGLRLRAGRRALDALRHRHRRR